MTLVEFLRARLDEDYEVAWGAETSPWREGAWDGEVFGPREVLGRHGDVTARAYYGGTYAHILRFDPTRILADIEAKRRIVARHQRDRVEYPPRFDEYDPHEVTVCAECGSSRDPLLKPCPTLRDLAQPFADHPDYNPEWRP